MSDCFHGYPDVACKYCRENVQRAMSVANPSEDLYALQDRVRVLERICKQYQSEAINGNACDDGCSCYWCNLINATDALLLPPQGHQ